MISKNDRVSLTLFDEGIRKFLPPGSTRSHLNDLLTTLENNQPGSGTSIIETLARAHPLLKRRGTLVLLSDFFCDPADLFRALNPYLHRGFRIHLFHLLDPAELDLGRPRPLPLRRHGNRRAPHRPPAVPAPGMEGRTSSRHTRSLRSLAASRQADYALTSTTDSYFTLFDRLRD